MYKSAAPLAKCEEPKYKAKKDFKSKDFEILEEYKGKDLEGKAYEPLFSYYQEKME